MCGHVSVQLCAVGESVAAQRTAKVVLALLVSVFNVFLQRGVTLVTARAVRTGEELRKRVWRALKREIKRLL